MHGGGASNTAHYNLAYAAASRDAFVRHSEACRVGGLSPSRLSCPEQSGCFGRITRHSSKAWRQRAREDRWQAAYESATIRPEPRATSFRRFGRFPSTCVLLMSWLPFNNIPVADYRGSAKLLSLFIKGRLSAKIRRKSAVIGTPLSSPLRSRRPGDGRE